MSHSRSVFVGAVLLGLACGGGGTGPVSPPAPPPPPPPPPPAANTVVVARTAFDPSALTVARNVTVTWQFQEAGHNLTFEDNISNSNGDVSSGGTAARTFTNPGTFRYRCTNHSSGFGNSGEMVGSITTQ